MLDEICVAAPAKINLGLKVLPKRQDGFHEIESIFSTIGFADEIIVKPEGKRNTCTVECDLFKLPEQNTITLTYDAFKKLVNEDLPGLKVSIRKKIPSGGGLGGGSSDAAAFLNALCLLCRVTLDREQLNLIASMVGSDVFFFVNCDKSGEGAAIVTGRGEFVEKIQRRKDLHYLLLFPGVHSSTKEAYDLVDKFYESGDKLDYPALADLEGIYNGEVSRWNFVNTFTKVIAGKYPVIEQAILALKKSGALYTDMSGSGSTVFGLFATAEDAIKARNTLSGSWNVCYCV
ncbi:MAG: 4-(cytidine 5'-diphospho)-2-C-methyl-D-erythritol kinase [Treponema sp.]|uniref:4-(cytidine 5'-diphospho)-2-C-methyl-D-erythritol kinase n=1 Tax=Treponema sp. TaxID=166 RepID=UPI00298EBB8B|nr:4-(cytidine 5'-diphospho)-2-C-methyl-D-erythritol kinase [Treponema sp.]MCR5387476.1 4-(cytidine 5'-diphospho)-2-C-methyl-D-erythritol kinase [Treponema sp.]